MSRKVSKSAIVSGILGNALEWYDYTLYSSFASMFATVFFSGVDAKYSLVKTFAIFAMGYVVRPFGALLFGYIGDVKGRKVALLTSVILMMVATFLMGCIPQYSYAGGYAVVMLIAVRMLQGIAIGGEFSLSSIYLVEHAPNGRSGLYGSFAMASLAFGITVGTIVFLVVGHFFGPEEMYRWAWRIPFLASGVFGILLMVCKYNLMETRSFLKETSHSNADFSVVARNISASRRNILYGIAIAAADSVPFYIFAIALRTILEMVFGYSFIKSAIMGIVVIQSYGVMALFSGYLSDKFSEKKVLTYACIGMILVCIPCIFVLQYNAALVLTYWFSICVGSALGLYHGSLPSFFVKMFPSHSRSTSIALSYNSGIVIFGSTGPMLFSFLITVSGGMYFLAIYIFAIIGCALYAIRNADSDNIV